MLPEKGDISWLASAEPANNVTSFSQPLDQLLEECFESLQTELAANGSSRHFIELRRHYGERIRSWWSSKRQLYQGGLTDPKKLKRDSLGEGVWVQHGNEQINVQQSEDYDNEDDKILVVKHQTPLSESELTVTVNTETGLDVFLHPPKISSKYRLEPDGDWIKYWDVVCRGQSISTITRTKVFDHPNFELPYVKYQETIDASNFGVDLYGDERIPR